MTAHPASRRAPRLLPLVPLLVAALLHPACEESLPGGEPGDLATSMTSIDLAGDRSGDLAGTAGSDAANPGSSPDLLATVDLATGGCPGPNPQGCVGSPCPAAHFCNTKLGCHPSQCKCDVARGAWSCTEDCGGGTCVPLDKECPGPNPEGCRRAGCAKGQVCDLARGCHPSECVCDPRSGSWGCTKDCGGGECVPAMPGGCQGANPEGCKNAGCPKGLKCDVQAGCLPSTCRCDAKLGMWLCTRDCGGGLCI